MLENYYISFFHKAATYYSNHIVKTVPLRPQKVAVFPKIGLVNLFYKSNVYENIYFLFHKNTHKQKNFH